MGMHITSTPEDLLLPGLKAALESHYKLTIDAIVEQTRKDLEETVEKYLLTTIKAYNDISKDHIDLHITLVKENKRV